MTNAEALNILENMPEVEFQEFYNSLPYRTRLCCEGGLVNWKDVLPQWWVKRSEESEAQHDNKR